MRVESLTNVANAIAFITNASWAKQKFGYVRLFVKNTVTQYSRQHINVLYPSLYSL